MCMLLASAKYSVQKHMNCNCPDVSFKSLSNRKDINLQNAISGESGRDVCFFEKGNSWPDPEMFHSLFANFTGGLVTILRDPWSRFKSNYERAYARCGHSCPFHNVKEFANMTFFDHYDNTLFSRPNFYVRMLNGLAGSHPQHLDGGHLQAAREVLRKFHAVIFLEQEESQRRQVLKYICSGLDLDLPAKTNNPFSNMSHTKGQHTQSKVPPDPSNYEARFKKENSLDYDLYRWALDHFTSDAFIEAIRLRMDGRVSQLADS